MTWTYLGLQQISEVMAVYDADLDKRLAEADADRSAQKVLNENEDWKRFNQLLRELEKEEADPADLDAMRPVYINRKRRTSFLQCSKYGLTVVYYRDPLSLTATPLLFFRERDQTARFEEMLSLLPAD